MQSAHGFLHISDRTFSPPQTFPDLAEFLVGKSERPLRDTTGRGIDGTAERSEGLGERPLEEAEYRMSGGRGKEEDHVEDH